LLQFFTELPEVQRFERETAAYSFSCKGQSSTLSRILQRPHGPVLIWLLDRQPAGDASQKTNIKQSVIISFQACGQLSIVRA